MADPDLRALNFLYSIIFVSFLLYLSNKIHQRNYDSESKYIKRFLATNKPEHYNNNNSKDSFSLCIPNSWYTNIITSQNIRIKMFLICHDHSSKKKAREFAKCWDPKNLWISIVHIPSTVFFESIIYKVLNDSKHYDISSLDYIIIETYKTVSSFDKNHINELIRLINVTKSSTEYDVIPFLRGNFGIIPQAIYYHSINFKIAWDALLLEMGYNLNIINKFEQEYYNGFYRNAYIAKKDIYLKLESCMIKAMDIAQENEKVAQLIEVNAQYFNNDAEHKKIAKFNFGTDYYQLHPFIFERLPIFFLYAMNATLCITGDKLPCPCNI